MPGINATGTNTAISTRVVATMGPRTSSTASAVIFFISRCPPSSSLRMTFSTTTMASSTTRATARTMPSMLNELIENPKIFIKAKVPISETGTAIVGIRTARKF